MNEALRAEIARFVRESPANRHPDRDAPYFDAPLVGVASADDPLFERYRDPAVVGPFHRMPRELVPGAASVVVWVLPIPPETRRSNREDRERPSLAWARTRSFGEGFNLALRRHVVAWLGERGHAAVAPLLASDWRQLDVTPAGIASTWSERHAAYAAGLGTFSLSDGFITAAGIAHRLGSVVTTARLPPTSAERPGPRAHCLFYEGRCSACIGRCPAGAISAKGHDKDRCNAYLESLKTTLVPQWGTPNPGCGLCQVQVPCEARIPPLRKKGRARDAGV
jgi:epoxyqueuosine reductase QueG